MACDLRCSHSLYYILFICNSTAIVCIADGKYSQMQFIEKFDRDNIDGQHLRQPVLAIATMVNIFPHQKYLCYALVTLGNRSLKLIEESNLALAMKSILSL